MAFRGKTRYFPRVPKANSSFENLLVMPKGFAVAAKGLEMLSEQA